MGYGNLEHLVKSYLQAKKTRKNLGKEEVYPGFVRHFNSGLRKLRILSELTCSPRKLGEKLVKSALCPKTYEPKANLKKSDEIVASQRFLREEYDTSPLGQGSSQKLGQGVASQRFLTTPYI